MGTIVGHRPAITVFANMLFAICYLLFAFLLSCMILNLAKIVLLMQLIHCVCTWSFATTDYRMNLHVARIYIVIDALDVR